MSFSFTVGGAKVTFEGSMAAEVADVLDNAFGAEGDWEAASALDFGRLEDNGWLCLQRRAIQELGKDNVANLLGIDAAGRGVYLPACVRTVSLPLSSGAALACASLPGLRSELAELAERWGLPLDDEGLNALLRPAAASSDDGGLALADPPEVIAYAHLALAANEAVRRDCPLWLVGEG